MLDRKSDHKQQWQPPPRLDWVQKVNEEGYCMDIRGVVPLDEKSLLDSAMRATGLSDFGADDWREPFQILIKSFEEDADLNLIGRIRARAEILNLLQARLMIEESYKRHPEIEDEEIRQPIFVIGQGRSGTSFLVNMLAANPDNSALLHWEAMFPCPPPERATYKTDIRIEKADKLIKQWNRFTPNMESIHEFAATLPIECSTIIAINFMSAAWFAMYGQVASYAAYIMSQDPEPALRYHKRVLKLLQWKNPRKHCALKDPIHLERMETLLKIYPDACFIWTHRDPVKALASTVSLVGTVQYLSSDSIFKGGSFDHLIDPMLSAQRIDLVIEQIEQGIIPKNQICHIHYKDLVSETMKTLEDAYKNLSIELTDAGRQGMLQYLTDNPRDGRPSHKFNIGSDAAVKKSREAFKHYQNYFKIPNE